jgi:hypothetical protein
MRVSSIENPGELADIIVAQLNLKLEDKQNVLTDLLIRLARRGTNEANG